MLAKVFSFILLGIEAYPIEIEVDISSGLPVMTLVGLADTAIRESKERVKAAIKNSGFSWPAERITVSLAPSNLRKEGACFDLAIALGILAATGQLENQSLKEYSVLGELSLDGFLRPVPGALAVSISAAKSNRKKIIVPWENAKEAALVGAVKVFALSTLRQTVEMLNSPEMFKPQEVNLKELFQNHAHYQIDFSEVKGQYLAKRALEVAVAGAHNALTSWTQYHLYRSCPEDRRG